MDFASDTPGSSAVPLLRSSCATGEVLDGSDLYVEPIDQKRAEQNKVV